MAGVGANIQGSYTRTGTVSSSRSRLLPTKWGQQAIESYLADYERLRQKNPYQGQDLGYSQGELETTVGGARDLAGGAYRGARESISDEYSAPGGPGIGSYSYKAALAGLDNERAAEIARGAREATLSNAMLRRQDYERRLRAGETALGAAESFATRSNRASQTTRQGSVSGGVSYV